MTLQLAPLQKRPGEGLQPEKHVNRVRQRQEEAIFCISRRTQVARKRRFGFSTRSGLLPLAGSRRDSTLHSSRGRLTWWSVRWERLEQRGVNFQPRAKGSQRRLLCHSFSRLSHVELDPIV